MSIVVGVDGSAESFQALEWACGYRRPLKIIHVGEDPAVLREAEARTPAEAELTTHLVPGDPGAILVAESETADLVVVGGHGHSRIKDTFGGGSVAMHTAMHARCPVVVFRPHRGADPEGVVVGVDASPLSLAAAGFAVAEARRLQTGVTAIHTWIQPVASGHDSLVPLATDLEALQRESEALLSESLAGIVADNPDVRFTMKAIQGVAGGVLTEASDRARLLVVGSHGRGPLAGLLLGSTSQAVLHHAGCPVAVTHLPA